MKAKRVMAGMVGVATLMLASVAGVSAQSTEGTAKIVATSISVDPDSVDVGQNVTVRVTVLNIGEAAGTETIELTVDGALVDNRDVTLEPEASQSALFVVPGGNEGVHTVAVGTALARYTVGTPPEPVFRQGPTVRLRPLNDQITTDQDGLIELFISNPAVNDVTLVGEVIISVPSGIHVYGEGFGTAGAAGTVRGEFNSAPGQADTVNLFIKAERTGKFFVHFSGLYWPEGDKNAFQVLSLTAPITVTSASVDAGPPAPTGGDAPQNAPQTVNSSTVTVDEEQWYESTTVLVLAVLLGVALIILVGRTVVNVMSN